MPCRAPLHWARYLRCLALGPALAACSGAPEKARAHEPEGLAALAPATDENPDPNILEVTLVAGESTVRFPGTPPTPVWTYNGTLPGPLIDAQVGDELRVHFVNQLPESTTIHWHGVRVPAAMDGTTAMQDPVEPGGTFEYSFKLKDAGFFWFHPHIRSDVQVEKGLYGVIRVRGADEPASDTEQILVLDDISVLPDGTLPTYLDDESKMLGRQGNLLLVNGRPLPTLRWRAGSMNRLRLVNTANGRFFNLSLPGYTWRVIGTDGGLIPKPYDTEHLLIAPGERYDVMLLVTGDPGSGVTLWDDPYDRGHDTGAADPLPVAHVVVEDEAPLGDRTLPDAFPAIERLANGDSDVHIELDEGLRDGEQVFTINGETYPDVPPISLPLGEVRHLEVQNLSPMDHPFHVHGTFFQVQAANGSPVPDDALAQKDTVIIPQMSTLKLAIRFDEPGDWMYHCHILEHAENGMLGEINVNQ
jgi:FtsP/CotA-like multicopper oxidase with cupredoxin domain